MQEMLKLETPDQILDFKCRNDRENVPQSVAQEHNTILKELSDRQRESFDYLNEQIRPVYPWFHNEFLEIHPAHRFIPNLFLTRNLAPGMAGQSTIKLNKLENGEYGEIFHYVLLNADKLEDLTARPSNIPHELYHFYDNNTYKSIIPNGAQNQPAELLVVSGYHTQHSFSHYSDETKATDHKTHEFFSRLFNEMSKEFIGVVSLFYFFQTHKPENLNGKDFKSFCEENLRYGTSPNSERFSKLINSTAKKMISLASKMSEVELKKLCKALIKGSEYSNLEVFANYARENLNFRSNKVVDLYTLKFEE